MFKLVRRRKAKGFTLVELLIVMVIIGILAGAMLLVMGSGKDKANATKIVSNLRSMKAAALMYYFDHNDWPTSISDLDDYMDRPVSADGEIVKAYDIDSNGNGVYIKATLEDGGFRDKLKEMATENGLYANMNGGDYTGGDNVYVKLGSK
ncbi:type II secretion system protein [Thermovirga lienii]|uniref:type II secretion system protein n=1 Tax=Thermovirga lienii TaxID=336261 RepID=UPI002FE2F1EE